MRPIHALALLLLAASASPVHAAESYDSCTGTITSLPTTLTTQGTWCLQADLATTIASGAAITVATNNVTIDCNGFKLGNLGAGINTGTTAIVGVSRSGVTVRNCNIRGFRIAINLDGDASGNTVEDNRIESARSSAIRMGTEYSLIRRNTIIDTGGQNFGGQGIVVFSSADIRDNIIDGIFPIDAAGTPSVTGIQVVFSAHYTIRGNVVRDLTTLGHGGTIRGIDVFAGEGDIIDNTLSAVPGATTAIAIDCFGDGFVRDNRASGFLVLTDNCPAEGTGNELRN